MRKKKTDPNPATPVQPLPDKYARIMLWEDFRRARPDMVGSNYHQSYMSFINRAQENGLIECGALFKKRGTWFVDVDKFLDWFTKSNQSNVGEVA